MKRIFGLLSMVVLLSGLISAPAKAEELNDSKDYGVLPRCDAAGHCMIPRLPQGTLLDTELYNDMKGSRIRHKGAEPFDLASGDSFNSKWRDQTGLQFHRITPDSIVPDNLIIDCHLSSGCKYLFEPSLTKQFGPGLVILPGGRIVRGRSATPAQTFAPDAYDGYQTPAPFPEQKRPKARRESRDDRVDYEPAPAPGRGQKAPRSQHSGYDDSYDGRYEEPFQKAPRNPLLDGISWLNPLSR